MPFVLTEEQQMLRDSAKAYAAEKLPVSQLRALRKDAWELESPSLIATEAIALTPNSSGAAAALISLPRT